jgi:hypothetical protein
MKDSGKLVGLRRYQAGRPVQTQTKLLEALERMKSGRTLVVKPGFSWSKATLAREALVNINTVVKKLPGGEWVFPEVNERFERHKRKHLRKREASDKGEKKIATVLSEVMELRKQNRQLTIEVNRLGRLIPRGARQGRSDGRLRETEHLFARGDQSEPEAGRPQGSVHKTKLTLADI